MKEKNLKFSFTIAVRWSPETVLPEYKNKHAVLSHISWNSKTVLFEWTLLECEWKF